MSTQIQFRDSWNSLDLCDLGVKMAALAALGDMAALRPEGVMDPFVFGWRGVKDGESTLNLFFTFSFWFNLWFGSCMYGQADTSHYPPDVCAIPALTVLISTMAIYGDVATEGVLGFCGDIVRPDMGLGTI
jgi:hypothetical protein